MVWQVLQGEGDLWGHFQCPHNSKRLQSYKIIIILFIFYFGGGGGGGVEMHSLLWGLSFGEGLVWGNSTFNLYSIKTIMPMEIPRKP